VGIGAVGAVLDNVAYAAGGGGCYRQAGVHGFHQAGQDVVSGIYLFTVELGGSVKHRGKFVIIR